MLYRFSLEGLRILDCNSSLSELSKKPPVEPKPTYSLGFCLTSATHAVILLTNPPSGELRTRGCPHVYSDSAECPLVKSPTAVCLRITTLTQNLLAYWLVVDRAKCRSHPGVGIHGKQTFQSLLHSFLDSMLLPGIFLSMLTFPKSRCSSLTLLCPSFSLQLIKHMIAAPSQ